jgi:hypothetical protein
MTRCAGAEPVESDRHRDRAAPSGELRRRRVRRLAGQGVDAGRRPRSCFVGGDCTMVMAPTVGAAQC